jgi:hypothetical protein
MKAISSIDEFPQRVPEIFPYFWEVSDHKLFVTFEGVASNTHRSINQICVKESDEF